MGLLIFCFLLIVAESYHEAGAVECDAAEEGCSVQPVTLLQTKLDVDSGKPADLHVEADQKPIIKEKTAKPQPMRKNNKHTKSTCAFAFLIYPDSVDYFVAARALVKGLRSNGATSDIVALVEHNKPYPSEWMVLLDEDGVRLESIESMPKPDGISKHVSRVTDKLTVFHMTDYMRVALIDVDVVTETGVDPESIFTECLGAEFCAVPDATEEGMTNAGVMLVQPTKARFEHMKQNFLTDFEATHEGVFPEQSFLLRYANDPANVFTQAYLPPRYNSCSDGAWLLNTGKSHSGFHLIHGCSWYAKFWNMNRCDASEPFACRHSVWLFQDYHVLADPCFAETEEDGCSSKGGCHWCSHYCGISKVSCSEYLFSTKDETTANEVKKNDSTKMPRNSRKKTFVMASLGGHEDQTTFSLHTTNSVMSGSLYYAMIDRVAHPLGDKAPHCTDLKQYCGGNVAGLTEQLKYISGMGIDGLIISPLQANVAGGYHGFWPKSLKDLNEKLANESDVKALMQSANELDMRVVAEVSLNHFGRNMSDLASATPFNNESYYHDCEGCNRECSIDDWDDVHQLEHCRLRGLPDLDHDNPEVRTQLKQFVWDYVETYGFSAVRLDAARHMPASFTDEIAAGPPDAQGQQKKITVIPEIYSKDVALASKLTRDVNSPTLNSPVYLEARRVFIHGTSMRKLDETYRRMVKAVDNPTLLVNFINTHDEPRFLALNTDKTLFSNALAFVLSIPGIPLIMFGDEQDIAGGSENDADLMRVPLWHKGFNAQSPRYRLIKELLSLRTSFVQEPAKTLYVDDNMLVLSRGTNIVVVSNFGEDNPNLPAQRVLQIKDPQLCNIARFCDVLSFSEDNCIVPLAPGGGSGSSHGGTKSSDAALGLTHSFGDFKCIMRVELAAKGLPGVYSAIQDDED